MLLCPVCPPPPNAPQDRGYMLRQGKSLSPTGLGRVLSAFLQVCAWGTGRTAAPTPQPTTTLLQPSSPASRHAHPLPSKPPPPPHTQRRPTSRAWWTSTSPAIWRRGWTVWQVQAGQQSASTHGAARRTRAPACLCACCPRLCHPLAIARRLAAPRGAPLFPPAARSGVDRLAPPAGRLLGALLGQAVRGFACAGDGCRHPAGPGAAALPVPAHARRRRPAVRGSLRVPVSETPTRIA